MVYRSTPKTQQKKAARRRSLLSTALELFGTEGYHQTTVPHIVQTADSSIGAFYNHFRNKEDIFDAVLQLIESEMAAALNQAIAAAAGGVFAQMKAAVYGLVHFLATHPKHARILILETAGLGGSLAARHRRIVESHTRSVANGLKTIAQEFAPVDPEVAASCWVGSVHEAVFQWMTTPVTTRKSVASLSRDVALFNLRAVGAPVQQLFGAGGRGSRTD